MLNIVAIITTITGLFAYLNNKVLKMPATIGVMAISLLCSLILLALDSLGFSSISNKAIELSHSIRFDQVVLDGMLSFLLFAGALHVDLAELAKRKWAIGLLATIGVLITTLLFGFGSFYLLGFLGAEIPLFYCLAFGSLISATDPIAVIGIFKQAGAPKSLTLKTVGESLLNDGMAYALFLVLSGIAVGSQSTDIIDISLLFVQEVFGGVVYGVALGGLGYLLLKSVDDYQVEILLTLSLVVGGYALAQSIHVSGPIGIVCAGLLIGNQGRLLAMSGKTRENLDRFWLLLDEILNAVLFVMIGIEVLALEFTQTALIAGALLIPFLLICRFLSVSLLLGVLKYRETFTKHAEILLTWGGIRGAISVALALSLPPGEVRDFIVSVTYIIVVFSIMVQGLTVGKLVKFLLRKELDN